MTIHPAFPISVDAATATWATPVFVLMALTTVTVLIWQAVRHFRDSDDDDDTTSSQDQTNG